MMDKSVDADLGLSTDDIFSKNVFIGDSNDNDDESDDGYEDLFDSYTAHSSIL